MAGGCRGEVLSGKERVAGEERQKNRYEEEKVCSEGEVAGGKKQMVDSEMERLQ